VIVAFSILFFILCHSVVQCHRVVEWDRPLYCLWTPCTACAMCWVYEHCFEIFLVFV